MPERLISMFPKTRVNDMFANANTKLNFSPVTGQPYKDAIIKGTPNIDSRFYADFYKKIGIDIVVETVLDYPYNFLTEKTYRPIAAGRPFIVAGPLHTLSFLKSLGFKTFSSILNESYDEIVNPEERLLSVCQVILDIANRPVDTIKQEVYSIKNILIHNQQCLMNLPNNQFEYFKEQLKID